MTSTPGKILFVHVMGELGGAERSLLVSLQALGSSPWQPAVAAPPGRLLDCAAALGVPVFPLPLAPLPRPSSPARGWQAGMALVQGRRALAQLVAEWRPDLVHANTTAAACYVGLAVEKLPWIWQVRDHLAPAPWNGWLAQRAARVVAISSAIAEEVRARIPGSAEKLTQLAPAVDTAHFRPAADRRACKSALGLDPELPLLGMLAQFVPWKRHALFLEALACLPDLPWQAVLVGADYGRDAGYVRALRASLLASPIGARVHWLPWQDDAALLCAALDLCVHPAEREPFGRVLIEAMACGVPVIAADSGGPREILRPGITGRLCPPTPAAFAAAIGELLTTPLHCADLGLAARADIQARFSLPVHREALLALYAACRG